MQKVFVTRALALAVFLSAGYSATAEAYFGGPGQQVPVKKSQNSSPYGYYEYLPQNYSDKGPKVPVVVFLHGVGEQGNGEDQLSKVIVHGPSKLVKNGRHFPAIVVSPQSPGWWNAGTLNNFVNYLYQTYPAADPTRLYVTGLSMGGGGTWDYATAYPERVAAIVPICGAAGANSNRAKLYGKGIWAFHAYNDTTVTMANTSNNIDAITPSSTSIMQGYTKPPTGDMIATYSMKTQTHTWRSGNTVADNGHDTSIRFTAYQSGGHNSWTRAYDNNDMWNWLFTWTNSGAPVPVPSPSPSPKPSPSPTQPPSTPIAFTSGSVTIDFGGSSEANANVVASSKASGGSLGNLLNQDRKQTTAAIAVVKGFNGVNTNGTTAPASSTGFSANAARDSFFGNSVTFNGAVAPNAQLEVTNLDPNRKYDFVFFASRMGANGDNRSTEYKVTGVNSGVKTLNVSENTANVATVSGIQPGGNGKVVIDVKKGSGNNNSYGFFYLGALRIVAQGSASAPAAQEIRVDFGRSATMPSGWNSAASGSVALKTSTGTATPYDLRIVTDFNGINGNGTTAPASSLGIPAVAASDSVFGNTVAHGGAVVPKAVIEIRDLDPSVSYQLSFFASRMANDSDNRDTNYKVIGATTASVNLNATNNTSRIAQAAAVKPNASGVIRIEVVKGAANTSPKGFFYLGSLKIRY